MAYDDRPIRQTHPSLLAAAARRWSLEPAPIDTARVLEVGCAHGVNLMAMAARMPDASFVGVDVDEDAVEVARRRSAEAGLRNVRFEVADLRTFDAPSASFDYAIAHGVLSWVADDVGEALWVLFSRALSSEGIAYVSYDTKPGACMRDAIGLGLRASTQVEATLGLLEASPALAGTLQGAWLTAEIEATRGQSDAFVEQQFLTTHQRALSVSELWDWAARHGLHYVDDVAETGLPRAAMEATRQAIDELTTDRRNAEQLLDVAMLRQFRATVFSRRPPGPHVEAAPASATAPSVVPDRPRVLPLTRVEARELGFVSTPDLDARALHPLYALLIASCDGSRDGRALSDLVIEAARGGELSLPTASGDPASLEEVEAGAQAMVQAALEDLVRAGIALAP